MWTPCDFEMQLSTALGMPPHPFFGKGTLPTCLWRTNNISTPQPTKLSVSAELCRPRGVCATSCFILLLVHFLSTVLPHRRTVETVQYCHRNFEISSPFLVVSALNVLPSEMLCVLIRHTPCASLKQVCIGKPTNLPKKQQSQESKRCRHHVRSAER